MVLTAVFYSDFQADNVRKVQVVKYKVVYGQIKAPSKILPKQEMNQAFELEVLEKSWMIFGKGLGF